MKTVNTVTKTRRIHNGYKDSLAFNFHVLRDPTNIAAHVGLHLRKEGRQIYRIHAIKSARFNPYEHVCVTTGPPQGCCWIPVGEPDDSPRHVHYPGPLPEVETRLPFDPVLLVVLSRTMNSLDQLLQLVCIQEGFRSVDL